MMTTQEIQTQLFSLRDTAYRDFQGALIPTVPRDTMIGVRTPALRAMAKRLSRSPEADEFLHDLPHRYFDENQLHAFMISEIKDFDRCLREVERFLPYVDNWATCDQMSPKAFKKNRAALLPHIRAWLSSDHPYLLRFAIKTLMDHFLEDDFDPAYPAWVAAVRSEEYYINMMAAWYFATALAKQREATLPYFVEGKLFPDVRRKAIRKALESFRISREDKTYLRSLCDGKGGGARLSPKE